MKVAIAGYGIEGKVSYDYWRTLGHEVTIVDEQEGSDYPSAAKTILGAGAFSSLHDFDMVIRTASLAPSRIDTSGTVWSATNEFFDRCPAPIIGVTGTKGKGTTASLIASILKAAGKTVHLVGNIGVPALSVLPEITMNDIVVYELSSFQLWDVKKSPHIAVVLMIEQDHLDIHKDLEDYIESKSNIRRFQASDDYCIYHPTNQYSLRIAQSSNGGKAERYAVPDDGQVYVRENTFFVRDQALCSVEALQLPGLHNVENACAAISASLLLMDTDSRAIEQGLTSFTGLPHRLKHVRDVRGVSYYDDSIATTPGSAIAALEAFSQPKIIILGGKDKGAEYGSLIEHCKETSTHVATIGSNGEALAKLCVDKGVEVTNLVGHDMAGVVATIADIAPVGSVVILSPAAASFDMFKSYADRGEQFMAAVEALA